VEAEAEISEKERSSIGCVGAIMLLQLCELVARNTVADGKLNKCNFRNICKLNKSICRNIEDGGRTRLSTANVFFQVPP
jgi:hypothetical protein